MLSDVCCKYLEQCCLLHMVLLLHRHPLFPLLALLFEKCEQSTQGSDCVTSASFDVDIENFVRSQEKDGKAFFSEDPDLDNLVRDVTDGDKIANITVYTVKPKFIQTLSTFLTLSQFIRYSLENMTRTQC